MAVQRLAITEDVQERLGSDLCEALRLRFHPTGSCAVCHRPLASEPLTVTVQQAPTLLRVTVHHVRCARGGWIEASSLLALREQTYVTMAGCAVVAGRGRWRRRPWRAHLDRMPFVLVNPFVDGATLRRTDAGGLVDADMEALADLGFHGAHDPHPTVRTGPSPQVRVRGGLAEIDAPLACGRRSSRRGSEATSGHVAG